MEDYLFICEVVQSLAKNLSIMPLHIFICGPTVTPRIWKVKPFALIVHVPLNNILYKHSSSLLCNYYLKLISLMSYREENHRNSQSYSYKHSQAYTEDQDIQWVHANIGV